MHLARIRSAEFFVQQTVAKPGRKFYLKMKIQAASTSFSIRIIRTSCSRPFGGRDVSRGFSPVAVRARGFINLPRKRPNAKPRRGQGFPQERPGGSAPRVHAVTAR